MRRFALNNNQKDDYFNIIRQQCELIEMTLFSILDENLYDDLAVVEQIIKEVYEHEDYIWYMLSTIIDQESEGLTNMKNVSQEKINNLKAPLT